MTRFKISLTAKISGVALDWIKKKPPRSMFKRLFLETKMLLIPIMSGSAKSPAEGLKDSECKREVITTRGCTGEFSHPKAKKKVWFHVC